MVREYDKVQATAKAMRRRGGGFVQQLGLLIQVADATNRAKIIEAFPDYVQQYRAIAEKKDWYLHE
jgi:hypothetical protein